MEATEALRLQLWVWGEHEPEAAKEWIDLAGANIREILNEDTRE